jgi:hypothetical protein
VAREAFEEGTAEAFAGLVEGGWRRIGWRFG